MLDPKLPEQIKQQLALEDFLIFASDHSCLSVYFNGQNEMFSYPLDLAQRPKKMLALENEVLMWNNKELLTIDTKPLLMMLQPMQAMFTEIPKLILLLEFFDKRLDRCKQDWKNFHTKIKI